MNLEAIKKNKVGMIFQFSIPSIIAMVLTSLITVTDGFFTGNYVGKDAIAAINLGLPLVYFYLGIGLMFAVGGSVISGMHLGAGKREKANEVFNQTIFITACVSIGISILVFILFNPITNLLQAKGSVGMYFRDYYLILLLELPLMIINNAFGMFIRGEGNPQYFMKICLINVLGNIILDYLFVGPMNMGIMGIALASFISVAICFLINILYFMKGTSTYRFHRFHVDKGVLRETVLNGSSEFIGEMAMCFTMYAYNFIIQRYIGVDGITAFTIVGYVSYIFSMIMIGFGQGSSPLISFSFGAKEEKLAEDLRRRTNIYVLIVGIVVILVMMFGANIYSSIFVKNQKITDMVSSGVRIFVISFLFSGVNTITSFYFTSIGRAKESAIISSCRGLIILLICIVVLPKLLGMTGVWLVAPVTEALTFFLSIYYMYRNHKKIGCLEIE